jgi:hypothetical protein
VEISLVSMSSRGNIDIKDVSSKWICRRILVGRPMINPLLDDSIALRKKFSELKQCILVKN